MREVASERKGGEGESETNHVECQARLKHATSLTLGALPRLRFVERNVGAVARVAQRK